MSIARFLGIAAVLIAAVTLANGQSLNLTPQNNDFFVYENEDGSIFAADANGTYYFAVWQDYVESPFFQEHGMACGTDRLPQFQAAGTTSDCSSSNTNPATEYDPNGGAVYTIPVVFHVLRRNNGAGNVSDSLLNSQIDILNEDFGAFKGSSNGDPQIGVDSNIQFTLAGITRSNSNSWYNDSGTYYNSLAWDTTKYLNIYTNQAGGNLGYAYVPSSGGVVGNTWDRVVLNWRYVGRNAPGGLPYNQGRTGTHEVGHYLGLYHTFQGGCHGGNCYNNGDLICDTNTESGPFYGCGNRTTCSTPDPTDNYMDYTDDLCMNRFTAEQANRMRCTLANFRTDLVGGNTDPPGPASSPSPGNGAASVSVNASLGWTAGTNATSHDVYFGETGSMTLVSAGQSGTSYDPGTLATTTTYQWRIDEVNANGTTTGAVWSFTTESGGGGNPPAAASSPNPRDGRNRVKTNASLKWTPGSGAATQTIYFDTMNPPMTSSNLGGSVGTWPPGLMDSSTTYYWRVDGTNASGTTQGTVWSFTTR